MTEYTYKDVIIDPEDPRVEFGAKYYRADYPKKVLFLANNEEDYFGTLEEIDTESPETPFIIRTKNSLSPWACIIRKKEPEKKYVPFDFTNDEDRAKLRGAWIKYKFAPGYEYQITAVETDRLFIYGDEHTPESLLEKCLFIDGTPCGKLVEAE